jgi:NTP pyrophosphatase (non-canonical NTP hydrolase)
MVEPTQGPMLDRLACEMRENSERWFPQWHDGSSGMPLKVAYALGLAGEVGEVANVVKKLQRDACALNQDDYAALYDNLGAELADVFTYLLLLADEAGVDLVAEYRAKVRVNESRWGDQ